jgi:hypothetical protein
MTCSCVVQHAPKHIIRSRQRCGDLTNDVLSEVTNTRARASPSDIRMYGHGCVSLDTDPTIAAGRSLTGASEC